MQGIIIKDCIEQNDLLLGLSIFFGGKNLSVGHLDLSINQSEDVLLEASPLRGDFCIDLCVYSKVVYDIEDLSMFICDFFDTLVLISDNDVNPYSWILITKEGKKGIVSQVPEETDLFLLKK
jgi:hypothetical protein